MNTIPSWLGSGVGGTPFVLLHGMGSTANVWLPQLAHFGRTRQTVAWTAPGYGLSPALETLDWVTLARALADMLDTLKLPRIHLLGHSIGGMVAQSFYHHYPDRVASLILSATSGGFGATDPQWKEDFLRQRTEPLARYSSFAQAAPDMLAGFMGPNITEPMRQLALISASQIDKERYIDYMRLLVTFNRKEDLRHITAPTLLLAGELDDQAPPKGMKRMAEQIPNAQFQELAAVKHMANIEDAARFNQVVDAFLAQHP